MGYRSRWIAIQSSMDLAEVLRATGLVRTGEVDRELEVGLWMIERRGWAIIIGSGWDYMDLVDERMASNLAALGPTLRFYADDTPMRSSLTFVEHGAEVWAFEHANMQSQLRGSLPRQVRTAFESQVELQARDPDEDVDYVYDTAHLAGEALTGFRHEEYEPPEGTKPYIALAKAEL